MITDYRTAFNLSHILTFIITLPPADEIMEARPGQKVQGYTLGNTIEWDKDATIVNETINIPRVSMQGILMLFQEKYEKDPEKFVNPNITSVKITIEGILNMIYSQGLPKKLKGY